jgi:hypothetical protein
MLIFLATASKTSQFRAFPRKTHAMSLLFIAATVASFVNYEYKERNHTNVNATHIHYILGHY